MERSHWTALFLAVICAISSANVINAARVLYPPRGLFENQINRLDETEVDTPDYRLPNNTEPIHYDVVLTTNVHTGDTAFTGTVKIDIVVLEDTNQITLHARELTINSATIMRTDIANSPSEVLAVGHETLREFLMLKTNTEAIFPIESTWQITLQYNGTLRSDNGGFYISTYADDEGTTHYLATTQFESTDARHAFPCFDEPAKRATFDITINHSPTYSVISNMPVNSTKSSNGVTAFDTTVKMSTYLLAFIVSDFEYTSGVLNGMEQRIYSRKGTQNEQETGLVGGLLIEGRLAEYFDVPFALPKLDQAAIPDFAAGAMENWGLATYREEYLLYNKDTSTMNTLTNIKTIVAHEYAHMWFGDLVSIKWWTYLWLKEGFATLFEHQAVDDAYPEWGIWQLFHAGSYQSALNNDASITSRPMTHYVQTPNEISSLYDTISYSKAGSVLHMWQNALTNAVFRQGLHNYLTNNQFNSADEWDLFDAIQTAAKEHNYPLNGGEIKDMMASWTQQGGYPLLTVERNYDNGSFIIKQEPFFNDKTQTADKSWYVPVNYAVQSNPDFRDTEATHYLAKEAQITVSDAKISNDDWLILNKQSTGYYRINYDEKNWNLIIEGLLHRSHKIHPRNRAQLMHDAFRFSTTGRLGHSILLNMMTYLPNEDQYAPWSTANSIITTFNRYLNGDSDYNTFQLYVTDLVNDQYDKFGVNDVPGEQHFAKSTRNAIINIACLVGVENCLKEMNDKLKAFISDNIPIEPNLQSQTYCNGLRQSGDNEFNFVYNKLMNSNDQAERRLLISSLGCAQTATQIKKFIESSIDETNELRTQERPTLLSSAYSRGEVGLLTSIEFLDEHWEAYAQLSSGFGGSNPLNSDITLMSQYVVNDNQRDKLLNLVDKVKTSEYVSSTLETSVNNNIKSNYDWLEDNRDPLITWIAQMRGGGTSQTASIATIAIALVLLVSRIF